MKKILLIFTLFPLLLIAQDNIILKNGEDINTKIIEINESNIKYKEYNKLDGPLHTISKDEIFLIKYSNGEKEIFLNNSSDYSKSKNIKTKKILISGGSNFYFQNTFEEDNSSSTTNLNLALSIGSILTRNFVLGASFAFTSNTNGSYSNTSSAIGPFIRGYNKNLYSQVGYALGDGVNILTAGAGYQIFLNKSESVSFNPTFIYFTRSYNSDVFQEGFLIGFEFEFYL